MAIYDLIPYKIRVLANPDHFDRPKKTIPFDVEGTCIHLDTRGSGYHDQMFKDGKILELLFCGDEELYIRVRWDNDVKARMYSGSMIHRSSKVAKCMSIWSPYPEYDFITDARPYHTLHPRVYPKAVTSHLLNYDTATFGLVPKAGTPVYTGLPRRRLKAEAPTIFRTVDEVPVGHPNAVVKDGTYLVRVQKYMDAGGLVQVKSEVLKGSQHNYTAAKRSEHNLQYAGKSPRGNAQRNMYSQHYGGRGTPRAKRAPSPPALKPRWEAQVEPTALIAKNDENGMAYYTTEEVQVHEQGPFEQVVLNSTPLEPQMIENNDSTIDPPLHAYEELQATPIAAPVPADFSAVTGRIVTGKKKKEQMGKQVSRDTFIKERDKVETPVKHPFENTTWVTSEGFLDTPVKATKVREEIPEIEKPPLFDDF